MLATEKRKARKLLDKWLRSIGATPRQIAMPTGTFPEGMIEYTLETNIGGLLVTPMGDWIACRWQDASRAVPALNGEITSYCLKWNHHFYERITAEELLLYFQSALRPFLVDPATAA
jgi:hypothetical protein